MTEKTHFGYQQVPPEEKGRRVRGVFDSVADKYDLMNDLMSVGLHRMWKRFTIEMSGVRSGARVLDIAGGTADITRLFADRVGPQGTVVLTDVNAAMLSAGRDRMLNEGRLVVQSHRGGCCPAPRLRLVSIASDCANRALESEVWARDKLAPHAGKTMRFEIGPVRAGFAIEAEGRLAASETAAPDLTIAIEPLKLPSLLAQPARWGELAEAQGDAALASTLAELAPTLPWFVERLLARALGPIAGQQMADAGRRLLTLPAYAGARIADSMARYVGDEARLAVRRAESLRFAADVAELAARVDTLASRVAAIER